LPAVVLDQNRNRLNLVSYRGSHLLCLPWPSWIRIQSIRIESIKPPAMAVLVARRGINERRTLRLPGLHRIASRPCPCPCPCCLYDGAVHMLHGTLTRSAAAPPVSPTREVHACHRSRSIAKPYLLPCLVRSWAKENTIEALFYLFILWSYRDLFGIPRATGDTSGLGPAMDEWTTKTLRPLLLGIDYYLWNSVCELAGYWPCPS
jgi:hypothetical protein